MDVFFRGGKTAPVDAVTIAVISPRRRSCAVYCLFLFPRFSSDVDCHATHRRDAMENALLYSEATSRTMFTRNFAFFSPFFTIHIIRDSLSKSNMIDDDEYSERVWKTQQPLLVNFLTTDNLIQDRVSCCANAAAAKLNSIIAFEKNRRNYSLGIFSMPQQSLRKINYCYWENNLVLNISPERVLSACDSDRFLFDCVFRKVSAALAE